LECLHKRRWRHEGKQFHALSSTINECWFTCEPVSANDLPGASHE
jgi:hypothetical protein